MRTDFDLARFLPRGSRIFWPVNNLITVRESFFTGREFFLPVENFFVGRESFNRSNGFWPIESFLVIEIFFWTVERLDENFIGSGVASVFAPKRITWYKQHGVQ